jgi:hypothetical protein
MSNESSTTKLVLPANTGNSTSTTPTSSSPTPLSLNGDQHQQININGNGILNDGKLTSNNYQNGVLSDLQATFQGSSWSNVMDPLSSVSGDHSFDVHNGNRMFEPQTTPPAPLMTMQQQLSYQQVKIRHKSLIAISVLFFLLIGSTKKTDNSSTQFSHSNNSYW